MLIIALIAIIFIGINQIFISDYIFRSVMNNHTETMTSVLLIVRTGIENYLSSLKNNIETLTVRDDIINFDNSGKVAINNFSNHYLIFSNVTRLDSNGDIVYTAPYDDSAIGKNVLYQEHNQKLFNEEKSVISSPFDAVQGYKAIAIAVPVFSNGNMNGCVTGLIPFERLWDLYVSHFPITEHSYFLICNDEGTVIYSLGTDSPKNISDFQCTYKTFNDTTSLLSAQTGDMISIEGIENGDFLVLSEDMIVDSNIWHILSLTSIDDLKSDSNNITNIQRLFAYIIIMLFVIIAAVFITLTGIRAEKLGIQIRKSREYSQQIDKEKLFFKDILEHMLKTRNVLIIITDSDGEIIFISSQYSNMKGNLFSIIGIEQAHKLQQNLKIANINHQGFMSTIHIRNDNIKRRYLFSITPIDEQQQPYIVFVGFPYEDNLDSHINRDLNARIMEWFNSDIPKITVDTKGKIILRNSYFSNLYRVNYIFDLCDLSCRKHIIDAIRNTEQSLSENTVQVKYNGSTLNLRFTPIVNPILKVEFIAVEIH